ncbi:hypothetical protein K501DRAFT_321442 [Backusella circina FSU 941]|nr:hypothetical protein K501DRAFT_321442 [Backusella circina FSU 941]
MKFAKQLEMEAEDIPIEWRPFLLQYKTLKKLVAKVAKEIENRGLSATFLHESLEIKPYDGQTQRKVPRIKYYFIGDIPNVKPRIEFTFDKHKKEQVLSVLEAADDMPKDLDSEQHINEISTVTRVDSNINLLNHLITLTIEDNTDIKEQVVVEEDTIWIDLEQDDVFFKVLVDELNQIAKLHNKEVERATHEISDLQSTMAKVASPKTDMYYWRKIFSIYMDAQIFQGNAETDRSFRSVQRAKRQLTWFLDELKKEDALSKLYKNKESKQTFLRFIELNSEIIKIKHYQKLNQMAMIKILKKHDKRSGLNASQSFHDVIQQQQFFDPKLSNALYASITNNLITLVPQPDDYACPVCMSVAWRPIRLDCNHIFCVRCLIKAQKKHITNCPLCRQETIMSATALNLDGTLQQFLKLYFPKEIKEKRLENEREQAIEDVQAMTGKRFTEEQLLRMSNRQSSCQIM